MKSPQFAFVIACTILGCAHDSNTRPEPTNSVPPDVDATAQTAQNEGPSVGPSPGAMSDAGATSTSARVDGPNDAGAPSTNTVVTPGPEDRNRDASALTPISQGNSESEVRITAAIRRAVTSDGSLGFDAKNVKIITVGSTVTLRGPVATERERAAIEAYAKKTAGVTNVDDQIEVHK